MQQSGKDVTVDNSIVVCAQGLDNAQTVRQTDKPVTSGRGRMAAAGGHRNLRAAQRLALQKQQSEQEKRLAAEKQPEHLQRLKDQLQQRQQQQQDQQHVVAYPVNLEQRLLKRDKQSSLARTLTTTSAMSSSLRSFGTTMPAHLGYQHINNAMAHRGAALSAPTDAGLDYEGLNFDVTSPHSVGLSSTATSISEYEDLLNDIDSIAAMESEDVEIAPSLPNIVLGYMDALNPNVGMTTSNSCPAIPMIPLQPAMRIPLQQPTKYRGGRKREEPPSAMSEDERAMYERERVKKDTHNDIEKRRREKINDHIQELASLLPASYDLDLQNKKGTILQASVDYIKKLQRERERIKKMEEEQRVLERRNRQLQLQMQSLQINMQKQQQQYKEQLEKQQQNDQQQLLLQLQQQLGHSQTSHSPVSQSQQHIIIQHQHSAHQPQQLQQQQQLSTSSVSQSQQHQQHTLHQQQLQQQQDQPLQIVLSESMLAEIAEGSNSAMLQNDPLLFDLSNIQPIPVDAESRITSNFDLMDIGQELDIGDEDGGELGLDVNDCFNDILGN